MLYGEDELLPISGLEHLVYCERQAALIHIEGLWSDNELTALGRDRHVKVHEPSVEIRDGVRIVRGLRLRSLELGIVGIADVIEFHTLADSPGKSIIYNHAAVPAHSSPLRPFPVEYKKGTMREEPGYEIQLCAQAMCLEEMLGWDVLDGAIFFAESGHRWQVACNGDLRNCTRRAAQRFHELVLAEKTPAAVFGKKCARCSMIDLCLPKIQCGRTVADYLETEIDRMIGDEKTP